MRSVARKARHHQSNKSGEPEIFYVDIRHNPIYGQFITVYDKEVKENNDKFKNKTYTRTVDEKELISLLRESVSIILYGDKCVEIGIRERVVHPDAVSHQFGVKVAIFIDTRV